jgi:hypothetical protein
MEMSAVSDPQVALGVDTLQHDTSHASTVESFFLQGTGNSSSELEDKVVSSERATFGKRNKTSKYAIQSVKNAYSVQNTLEVCKQLQSHTNLSGDNVQGGGAIDNTFSVVDTLLGDAVVCGYMELFAQRTFCSENLAFVMAVEMYKAVWTHMEAAATKRIAVAAEEAKLLQKATTGIVAASSDPSSSSTEDVYSTGTNNSTDPSTIESRGSTLSMKSMSTADSSNKSPHTTSSNNLSEEFKRIPIEALGARLSKRICEDAAKIWFMFIDDNGENQISVDHKSLVRLTASVWGPTPPKNVTTNSSAPDLRKIHTIATTDETVKPQRRSSINTLIKLGSSALLLGVAEEDASGKPLENSTNSNEMWTPSPNAFSAGVRLAKKSLEQHVVPGFLNSYEYEIYQKRCNEVSEMLNSNVVTSISMSNNLRFTGMGGVVWPIIPTTSLLDEKDKMRSLQDGSIVYTLDLVLSDRYLFESFLSFLRSRYCPETLLCYRSLQLFRLTYSDWSMAHQGSGSSPSVSEDSPIEQLSWTVAVFFLSHGMPLEVPVKLSATYTRHLSYKLASPAINMFAKVERACYNVIKRDLFPEFSASERGTAGALTERLKGVSKFHQKEKRSLDGNSKSSCFIQ